MSQRNKVVCGLIAANKILAFDNIKIKPFYPSVDHDYRHSAVINGRTFLIKVSDRPRWRKNYTVDHTCLQVDDLLHLLLRVFMRIADDNVIAVFFSFILNCIDHIGKKAVGYGAYHNCNGFCSAWTQALSDNIRCIAKLVNGAQYFVSCFVAYRTIAAHNTSNGRCRNSRTLSHIRYCYPVITHCKDAPGMFFFKNDNVLFFDYILSSTHLNCQ